MSSFSSLIDISSFFIGVLINLLLVALICYYFKRKIDNLELSQAEQAKALYSIIQQQSSQQQFITSSVSTSEETKNNSIFQNLDLNLLNENEHKRDDIKTLEMKPDQEYECSDDDNEECSDDDDSDDDSQDSDDDSDDEMDNETSDETKLSNSVDLTQLVLRHLNSDNNVNNEINEPDDDEDMTENESDDEVEKQPQIKNNTIMDVHTMMFTEESMTSPVIESNGESDDVDENIDREVKEILYTTNDNPSEQDIKHYDKLTIKELKAIIEEKGISQPIKKNVKKQELINILVQNTSDIVQSINKIHEEDKEEPTVVEEVSQEYYDEQVQGINQSPIEEHMQSDNNDDIVEEDFCEDSEGAEKEDEKYQEETFFE